MLLKYISFLLIFASFYIASANNLKDSANKFRHTDLNIPFKPTGHFEFAGNITTVISRFSASQTPAFTEDPYLVAFKYVKGRIAYRLGYNGDYQAKTEDLFDPLNGTNSGTRKTVDNFQAPMIGIEYREKITKRFEYYLGFDFRYYYQKGSLKTDANGSSSIAINSLTKGWGVGPTVGFGFYISPRLRLFTEANLYYNLLHKKRTLQVTNEPAVYLENSAAVIIKPVVPSSLFLSFAF